METLNELLEQRIKAVEVLDSIDSKITSHKACTLVRCEDNTPYGKGCNQEFEIKYIEYLQTKFYVPPHGCTDGDYYNDSEGQWACPSCKHINRLWDKPDISALKHLFKSVLDVYPKN